MKGKLSSAYRSRQYLTFCIAFILFNGEIFGMGISALMIIFGLAMLAAGGEVLLRGAVSLANRLKLTPAIIGLTVVAAGTSVPELFVSVVASFKGSADIAIGNVVGSNIANITLILGVCALVIPLSVTGTVIRLEYPVMALVSFLLLVLIDDLIISRLDAVMFLFTNVAFTAYMITLVKEQLEPDENRQMKAQVAELSEADRLGKAVLFIASGVVVLGIGANITVEGAIQIGKSFNISDRVIGLTIVAIGTSLPELVTSLVAAFRGRDDIAIGNIIGSNLFNILGILGLSALFTPLKVAPQIRDYDVFWMIGVALILMPIMKTGMRVSRLEGGVLVCLFAIYTWTLL